MTEERLKEIKDSIDIQKEFMDMKNYATEVVEEEQELYDEVITLKEENERLKKELNKHIKEGIEKDIRMNECADEILKELNENHHLSYGVALSIRQKLIDYKELKGDSSSD